MRLKVPRWFEDMLSLDGTLNAGEQQKRTLFFAFNALSSVFSGLFVATLITTLHDRPIDVLGAALFQAASCAGMVAVFCRAQLSTPLVVTISYIYVGAILAFDLSLRSLGGSVWATNVLVVDFLLVMQMPARYTVSVVLLTFVWLIVMALEERMRFGLLDIPGLAPQGGAGGRRAYFDSYTGCMDLPCARDSSSLLLHSLSVFAIDFFATRQFATDILKEQATMKRTISTVQEIASLLAGYDVEGVAEMLKVHEAALPEGMRDALQSIEENLRKYKAYLPQTCLPFDDEDMKDDERSRHFPQASEQGSSSIATSIRSTVASEGGGGVAQSLGLSPRNATLLTLNIKDTLHRLEEDSARFSDLFTTLLLKTLQATEVRRGMVDVFVGDRIHCSFNTSKQCAPHATSALHAATLLLCGDDNNIAPHVNMGVATGKVLRGDMGCEVMRRFSMVGTLARDVNVLERAGRVLGCSVLCNRLCFSDAECEHELRLIPCKIELAAGCDAEVVAELVVPKEALEAPAEGEWMYMLRGNKQWEDYNTAVRGYLRGELSASAVAQASHSMNNANTVDRFCDLPAQCEVLQLSVHPDKLPYLGTWSPGRLGTYLGKCDQVPGHLTRYTWS